MKKYITLILVLFSISLFSQTRLDTLVFNEVVKLSNNKKLKLNSVNYTNAKKETDYSYSKSNKKGLYLSHDKFESSISDQSEIVTGGRIFADSEEELAKLIAMSWYKSEKHKKIMVNKKWRLSGVSTIVINNFYENGMMKVDGKLKKVNLHVYEFTSTMVFSIE